MSFEAELYKVIDKLSKENAELRKKIKEYEERGKN